MDLGVVLDWSVGVKSIRSFNHGLTGQARVDVSSMALSPEISGLVD